MPALSAVLITLNEEHNIARTLGALAFADEVLVVDSGSTDRTVEICRSMGARVLHRDFDGFGPQKRYSVAQATHDWVLHLDADEVVSPELGRAVRALLDAGEPPCAAYRLARLTVFMGRPLLHGPTARELHLRLFDRRRAEWTDAPVHEQVVTRDPVGELPGTVLHYTTRDLSDAIRKLDRYSSLAAGELVRRGKRRGILKMIFTVPVQFLRHYLLYQNFRNGIPGLAWSYLNALGSLFKYVKARELEAAASGAGATAGSPGRAA